MIPKRSLLAAVILFGLILLATPSVQALTVDEATLVKDVCSASLNYCTIPELISIGGSVFFTVHQYDTSGGQSRHLWKSDGTAEGTVEIAGSFGNPYPTGLTNVNGKLFFNAFSVPGGYELQTLNAAQDAMVMVEDINPDPESGGVRSSTPQNLTNVNGTLYFSAISPDVGRELWKHDPATGTTNMLRDINSGTGSTDFSNSKFTAVDDKLFFVLDDGTNGAELWVSDGTEAGTKMVKDINAASGASSYPDFLTSYKGKLFFTANDGVNGREVWYSNGEDTGTHMLVNISPATSLYVACRTLSVVGDTLFFVANDGQTGLELWKTDGTPENTARVKDVKPGADTSYPNFLMDVGGTLFFTADDGVNGNELWKSDGTETGTQRVTDINPDAESSYFGYFAAVDGTLYFTVDVGGAYDYELWRTDGENTVMAANIWPDPGGSDPEHLVNADDALFFIADHPDIGIGLWTIGPPPPEPQGSSGANYLQSGTHVDRVNTFTGELFKQYFPDIRLGGPMPLRFSRYYASGLKGAYITGSMGNNWRHNFEWILKDNDTTLYIVDHRGRLINFEQNGAAWNLTGKTDIVFQLTENAGVFMLFDPRDKRSYKFNPAGQLTSIEDGRGNVHSLSYDGNGLLSQVTEGFGRTLSFDYDENDHLFSVGDGTRTVAFAYTGDDLTTVTDLRGNATTHAYSTGGLMTSGTRPAGNTPYSQVFNDNGKVTTLTDSDGNNGFAYATSDTTITGPLSDMRVHTHTESGELSNIQDESGKNINIGSDSTGRRNAITDRMGNTTTYDYHLPSGNISKITNADDTVTDFSYTERVSGELTLYDLTGITHADSTSESFSYDVSGNLTSHTDPAGNQSAFTFNANGQPLTVTNTVGGVTTITHNPDATPASITDPAGNSTSFGYDALKRLNLITFADAGTKSFTFDDDDNTLTITDENGHTTTMTYDVNGNLATVTDPLANTATYVYDGNDRLLSISDPLGNTAGNSYNQLGKIKTITDENQNVTTLGYNQLGRLTSITDPLGNVSSMTYDAEGIISSLSDPLGNTTTFNADKMGRITKTVSPLGNENSVSYDAMGKIASITDALGNSTTLSRDARGLVSGVALPGGINATYTRNALYQITTITDPSNNNWVRSYDNMGRLTSSSDPLGNTITTAYDSRNRLSLVTYPGGLGTLTLVYDPAGNLTQLSYSDGTTMNYTYDANDRLTTAEGIELSYDASNRIANSNGIAISRDSGGRITTMTLAAGKVITYTYDANNRLTKISDWAGGSTTFSYDAANRLISISRPNGIDTTNTYDNDNRLTGITEGTVSSITLIRDEKGQITAATRNVPQSVVPAKGSIMNRAFDSASQVSGFTYDQLGRLINDGTRSFAWDLASRLTSVTADGGTTSFTYDAAGNRLSRTAAGSTHNYAWNYAFGLPSISVIRQDDNDLSYYIHAPGGRLIYSIDAATNARSFYHFDEMGNTIFLSDDAGDVIGSYAYTPYGQLIASSGNLNNPFTWQGQTGAMEESDGIFYLRNRYYDANACRFLSRNTIKSEHPLKINPYQYASGNPLMPIGTSESLNEKEIGKIVAEVKSKLVKLDMDVFLAERALESLEKPPDRSESLPKTLMKAFTSAFPRLIPSESTLVDQLWHGGPDYETPLERRDEAEWRKSRAISKRESYLKSIRDELDKARKIFQWAQGAFAKHPSDTKSFNIFLDAVNQLRKAEAAFEASGQIESVIPELAPIVVIS